MGLRAVALFTFLLGSPAAAHAGGPKPVAPRASVLVDGVFAFSPETVAGGFRVHPRVSIALWRDDAPSPTEGRLDVGAFGGWSHIPPVFYDTWLLTGDGTYEGSGAHWGMVMASVGATAQTSTPEGHLVSGGVHLVGGWMTRREQARVTYERYGVDSSYEEWSHAAGAGVLPKLAILFGGLAGPVFEASYFFAASHRGTSSWHLGLGFALQLAAPVLER